MYIVKRVVGAALMSQQSGSHAAADDLMRPCLGYRVVAVEPITVSWIRGLAHGTGD